MIKTQKMWTNYFLEKVHKWQTMTQFNITHHYKHSWLLTRTKQILGRMQGTWDSGRKHQNAVQKGGKGQGILKLLKINYF